MADKLAHLGYAIGVYKKLVPAIIIIISLLSSSSIMSVVAWGSSLEGSRVGIQTTPPLPVLPLPSYSQLKWQQREIIMFLHFGVNTYTDSEWGTGQEDPNIFNPTGFNANQWAATAEASGISLMILTAKHHDGFCLWPSKYTEHSVKSSLAWRGGAGDVVKDFVAAATSRGIDAGLYLSPWDRNDKRYGRDLDYNEYYLAQLQELLTQYGGGMREIWFDGAKGANATNMTYYFDDWFGMVKALQSSINVFSDAGPDVRWVGNENGFAGSTCWATINRTSLSIGNTSNLQYLNAGDPRGTDYIPAECDVSIRSGWFWHKSESPKKLTELLNIYYLSVGRNCVLLLNVPPNKTGLISPADVRTLMQFRSAIDTIFSFNLAAGCLVRASSQRGHNFGPENVLDGDHLWTYWAPASSKDIDEEGINNNGGGGGGKDQDRLRRVVNPSRRRPRNDWIEIRASTDDRLIRFNVVRIQEAVGLGQRIKRHRVYVDGKLVAKGTTVGYKRLHRISSRMVQGSVVRIRVLDSRDLPLISSIGLHFDPFWAAARPKNQSLHTHDP
ncbi:hypothetical protein SAY86_011481 [Trapa natans]|uniref:alpha-L-fucosidase n=1 Tax=Trapa natans TaxID=22666 RepID=A0AAN7LGH9_TRANT|nr:hypothetical protein SAY86_011481 [Trapa natans]